MAGNGPSSIVVIVGIGAGVVGLLVLIGMIGMVASKLRSKPAAVSVHLKDVQGSEKDHLL